ncbi:two-component system sensor with a ligand-binding domain protein [Psychroflexus sp. YR1-1]|uniref:Two-component system sensor with a ligand-binding domain protein n=1 Tax=Psychroflexus aurantiacus TaxID=2709310 RepID=A0A6B3R4E2_9FLAO|nr:sensor histidine kinase [Psychroflexus aurantiacus]NEV92751.1 two-component system sensor with a ligand-binding domain protein [Psychroflexus aurantiacus]
MRVRVLIGSVFWVILSMTSGLQAQNPWQIDVLTTEQGLPFRDIKCLTQDKDEMMWFGTELGLLRYDGYHFKLYNSNPHNPFFIEEENIKGEMLMDSTTNHLWYIANEKLFRLDPSTDKVFSYDKTHNIHGSVLNLMQHQDGSIWIVSDDHKSTTPVGAQQYLQKLTAGQFEIKHRISKDQVDSSRLISDQQGDILWSTPFGSYKFDAEGNLKAEFDLSTFEWYGSELKFNVSFYDSNNTHYFFPQQELGIFTFDENTLQKTQLFKKNIQFYYAIEDHQNHLWFAGDTQLYRMSPEGEFTDYTQQLKTRFEYSKIRDIFIDASQLLWVATDNGIFKIRIGEELFEPLFKSKKEGWGNSMRGIFEDKHGTIFAKCENKNKIVYQTQSGKVDTLPLKLDTQSMEAFKHTANFFVVDDEKKHVFTLGETLMKINLKEGSIQSYDEFHTHVTFKGQNPLLKLRNGKLLFGQSLNQLVLFDPKTETKRFVFSDSETTPSISNFRYFEESRTDSVVWIGTQTEGLLKIHLSGRVENIYTRETTPAISRNCILVIEEDTDGSLWAGTYGGGLNHISADGTRVETYTTAQELSNDNVVGLLLDDKNGLWISTYDGLSHFDKTSRIFQNFYAEDGLSHYEFNYTSFFKDSRGRFYFGGMNGLNSFNPRDISKESVPPKLRLLSAKAYNSKGKVSFIKEYNQTKFTGLELSPYDQYFEIDWTMTSYFQNQKNSFSTTLEGFEEQWFDQGNSTSIRYNQLPAGDYVLKIKGKDSRGVDSASILSIPISVRQIFYKRWWFIALMLGGLIGLFYGFYRYRLTQVLALERLRTKISSDLHDDVGSMLTGLAMQSEMLEMQTNHKIDKNRLHNITTMSRDTISHMRDLVWSIDSRRDTLGDLLERMQELAEEMLLPAEIRYSIEADELNLSKKINLNCKRNLFLIYKEAVTNIVKHSDANEVHIKITKKKAECIFEIKDNGKGENLKQGTGMGLANMKLRCDSMDAKLEFDMENGFGVRVNLPYSV